MITFPIMSETMDEQPLTIRIFQVDAFAAKAFEGNPAAVCPLDAWLSDPILQSIAAENNLSETAFFVPTAAGFHIRWFTPTAEVNLCGHATLASAYVLFNLLGYRQEKVEFDSLSGKLRVTRRGDRLELDFPNQAPTPCAAPEELLEAFGLEKADCLQSEDYILIFGSEDDVRHADPDLEKLKRIGLRGVAISAPGGKCDFVTRFFAPKYGIDEDPVTGSAYTQLGPYWSGRLGKMELSARQISKRGGEVRLRFEGGRVLISGQAVLFLEGTIRIQI